MLHYATKMWLGLKIMRDLHQDCNLKQFTAVLYISLFSHILKKWLLTPTQEPASQRDLQPLCHLLGGRVRRLLQDQQHRGVCRHLGQDEVKQVRVNHTSTLFTVQQRLLISFDFFIFIPIFKVSVQVWGDELWENVTSHALSLWLS